MATAQMQKFHSSLEKLEMDARESNIIMPFLVQSDPIPVINGKIQKPTDYYYKGNARTSSLNYRIDFFSINELSDKLIDLVNPISITNPIAIEFNNYYEIYPTVLSPINILSTTGITSIGSSIIQCTTIDNTSYYIGMSVSGTNIPNGSYITAITPNTSFTINNNVTTQVEINTLLTFTESIVLYYYRLPVNPFLDFSLDSNDRPIYGGGANVDLEFKDSVQPEIMARFLMLMGVSIVDTPLAQYANLIENKSNS
jgi:hypothetical protein